MYPLSVPSEVYKGYVAIVVLALIAATLVCILIGFGMTNMPKNGAFRGACTGARLTDGLLSGCVGKPEHASSFVGIIPATEQIEAIISILDEPEVDANGDPVNPDAFVVAESALLKRKLQLLFSSCR